MKKLLLPALLLSGLAYGAFVPYEPAVAWKKKSIEVCWGNQKHQAQTFAVNDKYDFLEYTTEQKGWIKDIITQEFTLKETGIAFTGWKNCSDKVDADIVLLRIQPELEMDESGSYREVGGRATIGQKGQVGTSIDATTQTAIHSFGHSILPYLNYVVLNTRGSRDKRMDEANYIKTLALHEFGHTAGLRHEHVRIDGVRSDSNCKRVSAIKISEEPSYLGTRYSGPYDHNSIMNYRYINVLMSKTGLKFRARNLDHVIKLTDPSLYTSRVVSRKKREFNVRVGLSMLDKKALKCMYVFDESTRKTVCIDPK